MERPPEPPLSAQARRTEANRRERTSRKAAIGRPLGFGSNQEETDLPDASKEQEISQFIGAMETDGRPSRKPLARLGSK